MKISRFEDLAVWQKARVLCVEVYRVSCAGGFARDYGLRDQIRRAAVSVMSNIAEGFERYSRPEFRHFLSVARGSAAEVRSQLIVAHDLGYLPDADFAALYASSDEVSRMLAALHRTLRSRDS